MAVRMVLEWRWFYGRSDDSGMFFIRVLCVLCWPLGRRVRSAVLFSCPAPECLELLNFLERNRQSGQINGNLLLILFFFIPAHAFIHCLEKLLRIYRMIEQLRQLLHKNLFLQNRIPLKLIIRYNRQILIYCTNIVSF